MRPASGGCVSGSVRPMRSRRPRWARGLYRCRLLPLYRAPGSPACWPRRSRPSPSRGRFPIPGLPAASSVNDLTGSGRRDARRVGLRVADSVATDRSHPFVGAPPEVPEGGRRLTGRANRTDDRRGRRESSRRDPVGELLRRIANRGYAELLEDLQDFVGLDDSESAETDAEGPVPAERDRVPSPPSPVGPRIAKGFATILTVLSALSLTFAYLAVELQLFTPLFNQLWDLGRSRFSEFHLLLLHVAVPVVAWIVWGISVSRARRVRARGRSSRRGGTVRRSLREMRPYRWS